MEFLFWLVVILVVIGMISNSVEKKKQQDAERQAAQEALRRRMEAENYILNSGDPEAIKMLMLARANPANYSQVLAGGMNRGNDTLKTALGVMTGVVAGNLVANAITASAVSNALEDMQSNLDDASSRYEDADSCVDASGGDDFFVDI